MKHRASLSDHRVWTRRLCSWDSCGNHAVTGITSMLLPVGPADTDSAGCLCSLERLQMAFCRRLAALPDGIGELQRLAVLDIRSPCHVSQD